MRSYRKPYGAEDDYAVCSGWDVAWREKAGGDWCVKFTVLIDRTTNVRTVIDILRVQQISFDEQ